MTLQRTYHVDDDLPLTDPGNELRAALSHFGVDETQARNLQELLYTATERGVLDFRIDQKDAVTLIRMIELAKTLDNCTIRKFRM